MFHIRDLIRNRYINNKEPLTPEQKDAYLAVFATTYELDFEDYIMFTRAFPVPDNPVLNAYLEAHFLLHNEPPRSIRMSENDPTVTFVQAIEEAFSTYKGRQLYEQALNALIEELQDDI